jgi:hypothetical protein
MSASLRNMRIRIFGFVSATTGGLVADSFAYQGEFWGRLEPPTGAELNIAEKADYKVAASCLFADDIPIPPQGLIRDCQTGTLYKIEAVLRRRQTREQTVLASSTSDSQSAFVITGEPASD